MKVNRILFNLTECVRKGLFTFSQNKQSKSWNVQNVLPTSFRLVQGGYSEAVLSLDAQKA